MHHTILTLTDSSIEFFLLLDPELSVEIFLVLFSERMACAAGKGESTQHNTTLQHEQVLYHIQQTP